jgi:uncharacterized protein YabN with tetrapyrrole methylase and pyrophosphatase domain
VKAQNSEQALASWARLKAVEKAKKGKKGALDGIPRSAPALLRASRAGEKASAVGFDWPDATGPRRKIDEELGELDQAIASGDQQRISEELGDTLQAVVNLARKLNVDAEGALRASIDRFAGRFGYIEDQLRAQGRAVRDADADEQDRLWNEAKQALAHSPRKARISSE